MRKWSFKEDYIVCKFCEEHKYMVIKNELLDELTNKLNDAGFGFRSRDSIERRACDYLNMAFGQEPTRLTKQQRRIYGILNNEIYNSSHREELKAYIAEKCQCEVIIGEYDSWENSSHNLTHMVHTAKGRRFTDVLEEFIRESHITPKTKIYTDVGMKQDTFSSIRRGKYSTISRENVFRICFGLRLSYENATTLMKSCGMVFREELVLDTVAEYHLKKGPSKRDGETYKYDCELIDIDLLDSGAETLFSEL